MKSFSLKFLDIIIGLVLGLGFQWWPELQQPWQFVAFIFVYLEVVDYWMDYGPGLKKFLPKYELDIFLDVAIMFSLFLFIYSTQLTVVYFFSAFILVRFLDFFWLLRAKYQYRPTGMDRKYVETWIKFDAIECVVAGAFVYLATLQYLSTLNLIIAFVIFRVIMRFSASMRYKMVHFV